MKNQLTKFYQDLADEPEIYLDKSPVEIPLPFKLTDIENIEGRSLDVCKHFSMYISDIVNDCAHKHNIKTLNTLSKSILAILPKITKTQINDCDIEQVNAKKHLVMMTKCQMAKTTEIIEAITNLKDHDSDPVPCPSCNKHLKLKITRPLEVTLKMNEERTTAKVNLNKMIQDVSKIKDINGVREYEREVEEILNNCGHNHHTTELTLLAEICSIMLDKIDGQCNTNDDKVKLSRLSLIHI